MVCYCKCLILTYNYSIHFSVYPCILKPVLFIFFICAVSERDRVILVNTSSMDNVAHTFAVQTLRKCGKVAKIVSLH